MNPRHVLTDRQLELVALYASGYKIDEIAAIKFLSYPSVKKTLASAKDRVGARNLTHLCVICMDYGVLSGDKFEYKPSSIDERRS